MLKKFLALSMVLGSMAFAASSAEAKTSNENVAASAVSNIAPQWQGNRRGNQRVVRTYVRTVRSGRALYRETYRVVTNRNGRTTTRLVSRVRVR